MSPPVFVKLAAYTGDRRYLEFMDREYKLTCDYLLTGRRVCFPGFPLFYRSGGKWEKDVLEPGQRLGDCRIASYFAGHACGLAFPPLL